MTFLIKGIVGAIGDQLNLNFATTTSPSIAILHFYSISTVFLQHFYSCESAKMPAKQKKTPKKGPKAKKTQVDMQSEDQADPALVQTTATAASTRAKMTPKKGTRTKNPQQGEGKAPPAAPAAPAAQAAPAPVHQKVLKLTTGATRTTRRVGIKRALMELLPEDDGQAAPPPPAAAATLSHPPGSPEAENLQAMDEGEVSDHQSLVSSIRSTPKSPTSQEDSVHAEDITKKMPRKSPRNKTAPR
jgi:hypothetical protein